MSRKSLAGKQGRFKARSEEGERRAVVMVRALIVAWLKMARARGTLLDVEYKKEAAEIEREETRRGANLLSACTFALEGESRLKKGFDTLLVRSERKTAQFHSILQSSLQCP
jgi:hypothetical protein